MSDIDKAVEVFGEAWAKAPAIAPGSRRRAGLVAAAPFLQGLSASPEWSEVVEANLRADLASVTEQRDQARALSVRLEQELAESERKLGLWMSGERPW